MLQDKFSSGSWKVEEHGTNWDADGFAIIDRDNLTIATVHPTYRSRGGAVDIFRQRGNAALIAAAPDLLAACEYALTRLENISTDEFARGGDADIRDRLLGIIESITEAMKWQQS